MPMNNISPQTAAMATPPAATAPPTAVATISPPLKQDVEHAASATPVVTQTTTTEDEEANKKKKCTMAMTVAVSITGGLAFLFVVLGAALESPFSSMLSIFLIVAAVVLGIVQCATRTCCCYKGCCKK